MKVGKAEAKIKMIMQAIKQFNLETTIHNECVGLNSMLANRGLFLNQSSRFVD